MLTFEVTYTARHFGRRPAAARILVIPRNVGPLLAYTPSVRLAASTVLPTGGETAAINFSLAAGLAPDRKHAETTPTDENTKM